MDPVKYFNDNKLVSALIVAILIVVVVKYSNGDYEHMGNVTPAPAPAPAPSDDYKVTKTMYLLPTITYGILIGIFFIWLIILSFRG